MLPLLERLRLFPSDDGRGPGRSSSSPGLSSRRSRRPLFITQPLECRREHVLPADQGYLALLKCLRRFFCVHLSIWSLPATINALALALPAALVPRAGNKGNWLTPFSGLWRRQNPGQSGPWAALSVVTRLRTYTTVGNPDPECGRERDL